MVLKYKPTRPIKSIRLAGLDTTAFHITHTAWPPTTHIQRRLDDVRNQPPGPTLLILYKLFYFRNANSHSEGKDEVCVFVRGPRKTLRTLS